MVLSAQTFTTLHTFDGTDGAAPSGILVQATDGNFYGATISGGPNNAGTAFKITPSGTLSKLCNFPGGENGANPVGGLIQAADGNFYGTTGAGGISGEGGDGTVFKITPSGVLTTLYHFDIVDGLYPYAGLVQGTDGAFYGTTGYGGSTDGGTVFKITSSGTLTTLHTFDVSDGFSPIAGLIQATNGNFYGTTAYGGANIQQNADGGTVFEITPSGTLTTLYNFCSQPGCTDGDEPLAALVQASNGDFYGTTNGGGANGDGSVFEILPGPLTTLYSFSGPYVVSFVYVALIQATDGNFYGVSPTGGTNGDGTVFEFTASGTLTTLHTFAGTDGSIPSSLFQATNGTLYGTTSSGGANGDGTLFSLDVGLGPFVETQPTTGTSGSTVKILGTDLTGTTSVTFNGVPATFTVASPSLIRTTVPAGATSGKVRVTTPSGTLVSNTAFRVRR
jgi:uncharacterized repeat protein (TIGR03803 family)